MPSSDGTSPSSGHRSLQRLLFSSPSPSSSPLPSAVDRNSLFGPPPAPPSSSPGRKKGLASAAFRGLGCASSSASQAHVPAAAVRSAADWQGKRLQRRMGKKKKGRKEWQVGGDFWCSPGIPFASDASVDCVVAHQPMAGRGRPDAVARIDRERAYITRRVSHQEQISSFVDASANPETALFGSELLRSGHLRNLRGYHRTPGGLEELMVFQTRLLSGGGMETHDRFRDWRLDVDNMSYEELLELGDKIGHVNTGLREEDIARSLKKIKHLVFDAPARHFSIEAEWKCSICQEEYEADDETGRLECGHSYHICCIKQWLLLRNACPVCKVPVL